MTEQDLLRRITAKAEIFGGKPIIRGMRISVELILSLLAQGETVEAILADYPDLEPEDIRACLAYAHAVIAHDSLDAVQIGPHDLSTSLGVPEQYTHPKFVNAVDTIIRRARAAGVGAGIHFWDSVEQEIRWAKLGANLIMHSADTFLFARQLRADVARFRSELDGAA